MNLSRHKYTQVVYNDTSLLSTLKICVGNMPGNFEVLTKGVSVESETQLNNGGCNVSPWHGGGMCRMLLRSGNRPLMECVVWTSSAQQRPGL